MTLVAAVRFQEDNKERVLLIADSLVVNPDTGLTDLEKKIIEVQTGLICAISGDYSAKTAFKEKTESYLRQCNSLSDVYELFNKKFNRSFKGMELSVIFVQHKSSKILVYEPPPDRVLRYEDKYVLIGSAAELVHADFSIVYCNQDWRDKLPSYDKALELCLDSFCKAISDQRGAVGLPLDVYLTNPCEYYVVQKTSEIWTETQMRVENKLKLQGIKSKLPEKKKLEFKPYEKKPEPKQAAPVQTSSSESRS